MDIPPPPPPMSLSVILDDLETKLKEGTTNADTVQHRFGQQYIRSQLVIDSLSAEYERKLSNQRLSERKIQQIVNENRLHSVFRKSRQRMHTVKRLLQRFQERETDFINHETKFVYIQPKIDNILMDLKMAIDNVIEASRSHNSDTSDSESNCGGNEESCDESVDETDSDSENASSSDSEICCENFNNRDRYEMHKQDFKILLETFFTLQVQRDNFVLIKYIYDKSKGHLP